MRGRWVVRWLGGLVAWWLGFGIWDLGFGICAGRSEAERWFAQGNEFYARQDFRRAAEAYGKALSFSGGDGVLYFNLGNAYFKLGRLGKAIWCYERAKKLMPRDPDVRENLQIALSLSKGQAQNLLGRATRARKGGVEFILRAVRDWLSINEALVLTSLFYLMTMMLLFLKFLLPECKLQHRCRTGLWLLTVPLAFSITLLLLRGWAEASLREAVVTEGRVWARGGPGTTFPGKFALPEGSKVRLKGQRGIWLEVQDSSGVSGWVRQDAVERI